jgi:hypothetical protein
MYLADGIDYGVMLTGLLGSLKTYRVVFPCIAASGKARLSVNHFFVAALVKAGKDRPNARNQSLVSIQA